MFLTLPLKLVCSRIEFVTPVDGELKQLRRGGVVGCESDSVRKLSGTVALLKAEQCEDESKRFFAIENFDKTEDEAKVLAHQIAGHKGAIEDYEEQLSNTDTRI